MERVEFQEVIAGLAGIPADDITWATLDLIRSPRRGRQILKASKQFSALTLVTVSVFKDRSGWREVEYSFTVTGINAHVQDYLRLLNRVVNGD